MSGLQEPPRARGEAAPAQDSPPSLLPLVAQGGEAGAPGFPVPAWPPPGVLARVRVELRAPGVCASQAGSAQGAEGSPQAVAPGRAPGCLPGSAGKCGVDPIPPPIPAAVGTSGERGAKARRRQLAHGDRTGFCGGGGGSGRVSRGFQSWRSEWEGWAHVGPRGQRVAVAVTLKVTEVVVGLLDPANCQVCHLGRKPPTRRRTPAQGLAAAGFRLGVLPGPIPSFSSQGRKYGRKGITAVPQVPMRDYSLQPAGIYKLYGKPLLYGHLIDYSTMDLARTT